MSSSKHRRKSPPTLHPLALKLLAEWKWRRTFASHSNHWNNHMKKRILDTTTLADSAPLWKRLMYSLSAGELSFLVRTSIDSLPIPTSLARWNMRMSPSCPLCHQSSCTASKVLIISCCPMALQQGRFTWRHDRALKVIYDLIVCH